MARWGWMGKLDRVETGWTAETFLQTDQRAFGGAWRYELVDGQIIAHAAPTPLHGQIHGSVAVAIGARLRSRPCRMEIGTGAAPQDQQRPTARIPDLLVRCEGLPRVVVEIVSPSELRDGRGRNRRRRDEQGVEGVQEVVEIYQSEPSVHIYRRGFDGEWTFEAVDELESVLRLRSLDLDLPLAEIYEAVDFTESE